MINRYFGGSFHQMASFFMKNENIDVHEMEKILDLIKKQPDKK